MGLFSPSTSPPPSVPKPSQDGAFEAPNRSARTICWEARDAFFACLDAHGIIDSIKDDAAVSAATAHCGRENAVLERDCARSWVTYFKQRRVMEFNKRQTLEKLKTEGARSVPEGMGPPQSDGRPA